jgi:serine phosphatase RsbU (regulator of sigma subunit)/uncharacterized protein HemY
MIRIFLIFLFLSISLPTAFSQNKALVDSLAKALDNAQDSNQVIILNQLTWQYRNSDFTKAIAYGQRAIALAELLKFNSGLADAYSFLGVVYRNIGDYPEATEYYIKALKLSEESKLSQRISYSYLNLGDILKFQKQYQESEKYILRSIQEFEKLKDNRGLGYGYIRLGEVYQEQKKYGEALNAFNKSLIIREEMKDKPVIESSLNRLGNLYDLMKDYDNALEYFNKSIALSKELGDRKGLAGTQADMSRTYLNKNQIDKAIIFAQTSLDSAQKMGSKDIIKKSSQVLAEVYAQKNDFVKAYQYQALLMQAKDGLFNEESTVQISSLRSNYEAKKKQAEIDLLSKDKQLNDLIRNVLMVGLALFLIGIFILFRILRRREELNKILEKQNKIIERKNEDVTASIYYAKRIQDAMIPSINMINKHLPEAFILFRPRDIVSGDFYWITKVLAKKVVLVSVDCTGHGVPGAFMSVIGSNLLNQIVLNMGVTDPDVILTAMNVGVIDALKQEATNNHDSMDTAVCVIDLEKKVMEFAGAKSPLIYFQNNEMHYIKGDPYPVGDLSRGYEKTFKKHTISFSAPMTFYIFSDGFVDQFGGAENKKFMIKNFRQLLADIHTKSMQEQQTIISKTFADWIGNQTPQVDDVTVVGVRLS